MGIIVIENEKGQKIADERYLKLKDISKENIEISISNETMRLVGFVKKDAYDEVNEMLRSISEKYRIMREFFPQLFKTKEVDESLIKKIEQFERLAEKGVWG